jgi:hypothetical protein
LFIIINYQEQIDFHGWMEWVGNGEEPIWPFLNGKMDFSAPRWMDYITNIDYQVWRLSNIA